MTKENNVDNNPLTDFENLQKQWNKYYEIERYNGIEDYIEFHNAIDRFIWLIRLKYADKEIIKSKQYRLDTLFQWFIKKNSISIDNRFSKLIGKDSSKERFIYYLKQGWYNELSITYPFVDDPLDIGTSINFSKASWKVDLFPSWYIIKSYYTVYSFYNAFPFTNTDKLNTFQHRKTTNHFNNSMLKKFSNTILYYPFNISIPLLDNIKELRKGTRREWEYKYSKYPRNDMKDFYDVESDFVRDLKIIKENLHSKATVNFVDLLYNFRIWANYVGNETIVKLRTGGLLLFLERNLFTITFFTAGLCEILALGFLGEEKFLQKFMSFYKNFIQEKEELYSNWYSIPQIVRLRIYNHLNLISELPKELVPPNQDSIILV